MCARLITLSWVPNTLDLNKLSWLTSRDDSLLFYDTALLYSRKLSPSRRKSDIKLLLTFLAKGAPMSSEPVSGRILNARFWYRLRGVTIAHYSASDTQERPRWWFENQGGLHPSRGLNVKMGSESMDQLLLRGRQWLLTGCLPYGM